MPWQWPPAALALLALEVWAQAWGAGTLPCPLDPFPKPAIKLGQNHEFFTRKAPELLEFSTQGKHRKTPMLGSQIHGLRLTWPRSWRPRCEAWPRTWLEPRRSQQCDKGDLQLIPNFSSPKQRDPKPKPENPTSSLTPGASHFSLRHLQ